MRRGVNEQVHPHAFMLPPKIPINQSPQRTEQKYFDFQSTEDNFPILLSPFKIILGMITNNQNFKKGGTYRQLNQGNDNKLL